MGDPFGTGTPEERPVHTVEVSAFFVDTREVTWALWQEVRDRGPGATGARASAWTCAPGAPRSGEPKRYRRPADGTLPPHSTPERRVLSSLSPVRYSPRMR